MPITDLLILMLVTLPIIIAAALVLRMVMTFGSEECVPDERLLSAIKPDGQVAGGGG